MKKYFTSLFNLQKNTDFEKTKSTISEGVSLRGYNLWILLCSTILASIGLDTNSTAVIIGAMLISPLMSPILGFGLSLAIHDKHLLFHSVRNLILAVLISLGASILYFFLSPLGDPTPELQARTFPTLLDVLIALFGGIAGIVSISRHDQTNAIPGVAIATALMPPLCTAGFGIATSNWNYFFGAFYLFFINAVFISLATFLIVRYLHFPEKAFINKRLANQYRFWFIAISFFALTPSIYFLYTVYKKDAVKKDIETLVISAIKKQGNEILKWDVINKGSLRFIQIYHSGTKISDSLKTAIDSALQAHALGFYRVQLKRVNLTKEEVNELSAEMTKQMFQQMRLQDTSEQNSVIQNKPDTINYKQITREVKIAFPFIDTLYNGTLTLQDAAKKIDTLTTVFYLANKKVNKKEVNQLYHYLLTRFNRDTIVFLKKEN